MLLSKNLKGYGYSATSSRVKDNPLKAGWKRVGDYNAERRISDLKDETLMDLLNQQGFLD